MKTFSNIVLVLLFFAAISCKGGIKKDLERFIGQEVVLPRNMLAFENGKDTLLVNSVCKDVKFVVWYDSTGCSSCRLKELWQWEEYADYATSGGFDFHVILSPSGKNAQNVDIVVRSQRAPFVVYKDYESEFYAMNPEMPTNQALHTFLLDKDNKVVIAGNPLKNPKLAKLYRGVIKSMLENGGALP